MTEPKNAPVVQGGNFKELYKKKFGTVLAKNRAMTPEQLFDLSVKYFEWAEDNAIKRQNQPASRVAFTSHLFISRASSLGPDTDYS
ncbi:terminase small subunit [Escherichia phage ADB-2]|uniref:Uncharacterized protein n=1 Tax=Escherichia phage ADB-2 TaxID=1216926 RepID=K4NZB3_9CAUD|nr:terminase small subunit [Escherichia phage ADB-2]AFV50928.1 hypothetical protein B508_00165 [Escherichia phage ADB-2]